MSKTIASAFVGLILVSVALYFFRHHESTMPARSAVTAGSAHRLFDADDDDAPRAQAMDNEPARVQELEQQLATERRARQKAEADADALRAKMAPLDGNVVVSLGKPADMGRRAGLILPALHELREIAKRDPATLSPDERRHLLDLHRQHADVLGMLPEIAGFQDSPAEYGSFFRGMIQQAAGLTDAQAAQVEAFMRQRAVTMEQLGLSAAHQPSNPVQQDAWEQNRDAFNAQTAQSLRDMLTAPVADRAGINAQLMELLENDLDNQQLTVTGKD